MRVLPTCVSSAYGRCHISWNRSYGWLLTPMWLLGMKPRSFGRAVSELNPWDISLSPNFMFQLSFVSHFVPQHHDLNNTKRRNQRHRTYYKFTQGTKLVWNGIRTQTLISLFVTKEDSLFVFFKSELNFISTKFSVSCYTLSLLQLSL